MEGISREEQEYAARNEWLKSVAPRAQRPRNPTKAEIIIGLAFVAFWLVFVLIV